MGHACEIAVTPFPPNKTVPLDGSTTFKESIAMFLDAQVGGSGVGEGHRYSNQSRIQIPMRQINFKLSRLVSG